MDLGNVTNIFISNLTIGDILVIGIALPFRVRVTNFEKRLIGNVCEELVMANMDHIYMKNYILKINSKSGLH